MTEINERNFFRSRWRHRSVLSRKEGSIGADHGPQNARAGGVDDRQHGASGEKIRRDEFSQKNFIISRIIVHYRLVCESHVRITSDPLRLPQVVTLEGLAAPARG